MTVRCMSCGGQNDSWRSYCATCYQTQCIIKQMAEAQRRNQPNPPTIGYGVYGGYSNSTSSRFSWLLEHKFGAIGLFCWMVYMFWTLLSGGHFTVMDFIVGLGFFIWYGGEY